METPLHRDYRTGTLGKFSLDTKIKEIEDAHEELWNLGTIEMWPQPRPGDSFVCRFTPRENILMRVLRKLRLVKPAEIVSVEFVPVPGSTAPNAANHPGDAPSAPAQAPPSR
jgi:hypothetical protein